MHNQPAIGYVAIGTGSLIFLSCLGSFPLCSGLRENEVKPDDETEQDGEEDDEDDEIEVNEEDIYDQERDARDP